ncbi:hypothetical protein GGX14DRAFT_563843 [Mycena pura]|uniref:Uncharacterized protein n=1 Tax=Mycena pura TaxID=153505 RepID=A0AAD6VLM3_9AGAR|nr:hypothetical protein GGX14DRAFT_563843 [Mycena pura]
MPPTAPSHPCGYARNPEPFTHSQLMVVYPASWSIYIIGPAWSLIILYFAPALVWRIGTPVGSQTLPAPLGCLPNAPSALRDLIRALCDHSRYSEPFACLRLRFYDIGPTPCPHWPLDPTRIHGLSPRYTDGTPIAHPSPVQPFSVFRALHLLAISSLCLRHRISARFHPASLPGLYALVRSTVGSLPVASVLVSKLRSFTVFHLLSLVELGRTSPLNPTAFRGLSRLLCLVLVLCLQPSIALWPHHVSKALPHLCNAYSDHWFLLLPLCLTRSPPKALGPARAEASGPSSDYRSEPSL